MINHSNINPKRLLNQIKLHFNIYSRSFFVRNIRNFLNNFIWRKKRHNSGKIDSSPSLEISDDNLGFTDGVANKFRGIRKQHLKNPKTIIIGHLNINSIRNKFEIIAETIVNVEIFLISESKLDATFPNVQFKRNCFQISRRNHNRHNRFGGGLMFYLNEKIPCKLLDYDTVDTNIEIIAIEFHQTKRKLLLLAIYMPPGQSYLDFIIAIIKVVHAFFL